LFTPLIGHAMSSLMRVDQIKKILQGVIKKILQWGKLNKKILQEDNPIYFLQG
jgi:hypothetical protein